MNQQNIVDAVSEEDQRTTFWHASEDAACAKSTYILWSNAIILFRKRMAAITPSITAFLFALTAMGGSLATILGIQSETDTVRKN
jgi:hypothetical protein